jgi:hypothetical protein
MSIVYDDDIQDKLREIDEHIKKRSTSRAIQSKKKEIGGHTSSSSPRVSRMP